MKLDELLNRVEKTVKALEPKYSGAVDVFTNSLAFAIIDEVEDLVEDLLPYAPYGAEKKLKAIALNIVVYFKLKGMRSPLADLVEKVFTQKDLDAYWDEFMVKVNNIIEMYEEAKRGE